jgi:hypothetical protein
LAAHRHNVVSIEENAASCVPIAEKFAPTLANSAVIGARFFRTVASVVPMCANIGRTEVKVRHRRSCAPIVVRSGQTLARSGAIDVSFAKMFAIGVETFATTVMIGGTQDVTKDERQNRLR